jgi:hypothetical protein
MGTGSVESSLGQGGFDPREAAAQERKRQEKGSRDFEALTQKLQETGRRDLALYLEKLSQEQRGKIDAGLNMEGSGMVNLQYAVSERQRDIIELLNELIHAQDSAAGRNASRRISDLLE